MDKGIQPTEPWPNPNAMFEVPATRLYELGDAERERDQLRADLAACRARLAALVDGIEAMADANTNTAAALATLTIADASISARAWLAAHPAEGGQDGAVR